MHGMVGTILKFRYLVVVMAAVLMVLGIIQMRHMSVDVLPEFSPPHVEIQTEALGLSAEEVEQLITVPLEQNLLNGVAWLDKIHSESVSGLSSVTMIFEPGTDLYRARQMVAERLSQGAPTLPRVSRGPVMLLPKSTSSRVLIVRLSSKTLSAIQMSVLARWTITPRLMGVPGVANVATWGMRDRQLQVQVDPDRLRAFQISLLQLIESVGNALWVSTLSFVEAATPGNAGFIDTPQQRLGIQHISPIVSPESLSQVSVQATGSLLINEAEGDQSAPPRAGGAVRLIDVADVVENHQPLIGDARAGEGANLLLVIEKFPGSDTVKVTQGVEEALAALRPGLGDMEIDSTLFRPATYIEMGWQNLRRAAFLAGGMIALLIGLFLFNWRATLISLVAIPLSLAVAGLVLSLRGATLNVMVLIGLVIAIGVIVSDAIFLVENIMRRLRGHQSLASVILEAVAETRGSLLFAALICLLAVLPVFSLQDTAGNFFRPLAVTYVLAVLASTVVALIVTPALCAMLLPRVSNGRGSPLIRVLQASYEKMLPRTISRPRIVYLTIAILAGVGLGMIAFQRPELFPTFKERDLLIRLQAAPGTSHPAMVRLVDRLTSELRAIPGIRNAGALIGRAVFGDQVVGMNSAEVCVSIAPTANYEATVAAVHKAVNGYSGVKCEVQTYLKRVSDQVVTGPGAPIVVRLYGQEWTTLRDKAEELRQSFSGIAGVTDVKLNLPVEEPTLEVEVDLDAATRHGINPGSVRRAASALMNGIQVGSLFQEQKVFDVVVWSTPKTRGNLTDVSNLMIDTPFKVPVRLGDVAQVRVLPRPSLIRHEDVSRYVDIALDVNARDARAVTADIQTRLRQFQYPLESHAKVFAAHDQQHSTRNRLLAYSTIALIGILLLLQAAYESWRIAALSLFMLPLALVGGLAAAATQDVSLAALFGLLAVFGITTRNQTMLIRRYRHLEQNQRESPGLDLILQGSRELSPSIFMTVLTIGLALLPVLFMGEIAGLEALRPTAIIILSGLVTCAVVDLFLVPSVYRYFARGR